MMLVMLPFFMLAMYEKHGQPLEKIIGNILKVAVIRPKQRPYRTNDFYAVLERQANLDKEVYDIVRGKDKAAVSYTHLDVYKRQQLDAPRTRTGKIRALQESAALFSFCLLYTSKEPFFLTGKTFMIWARNIVIS